MKTKGAQGRLQQSLWRVCSDHPLHVCLLAACSPLTLTQPNLKLLANHRPHRLTTYALELPMQGPASYISYAHKTSSTLHLTVQQATLLLTTSQQHRVRCLLHSRHAKPTLTTRDRAPSAPALVEQGELPAPTKPCKPPGILKIKQLPTLSTQHKHEAVQPA